MLRNLDYYLCSFISVLIIGNQEKRKLEIVAETIERSVIVMLGWGEFC